MLDSNSAKSIQERLCTPINAAAFSLFPSSTVGILLLFQAVDAPWIDNSNTLTLTFLFCEECRFLCALNVQDNPTKLNTYPKKKLEYTSARLFEYLSLLFIRDTSLISLLRTYVAQEARNEPLSRISRKTVQLNTISRFTFLTANGRGILNLHLRVPG